VRFGRALGRPAARLVILDEPFRGLERVRRRTLLARARARWSQATLLCVTHDVGETQGFPRVLVVDGGRIVEDGAPTELARAPSRYAALLAAEERVAAAWESAGWKRLQLVNGALRR
jgi:ATP-binding cassette subfamily B protein